MAFFLIFVGKTNYMQEDNKSDYVLAERILILGEYDSKDQKMTVLIVDDSPIIITKMIELIEDVKTITALKTCGTYDSAIELLNNYTPNVILLDINLPGTSGIELLKYTKAYLPNTFVIIVTNQGSEYYKERCFKIGADHFVDKSKDFDKIPSILSSLA